MCQDVNSLVMDRIVARPGRSRHFLCRRDNSNHEGYAMWNIYTQCQVRSTYRAYVFVTTADKSIFSEKSLKVRSKRIRNLND